MASLVRKSFAILIMVKMHKLTLWELTLRGKNEDSRILELFTV